jgi:hypothetical protein
MTPSLVPSPIPPHHVGAPSRRDPLGRSHPAPSVGPRGFPSSTPIVAKQFNMNMLPAVATAVTGNGQLRRLSPAPSSCPPEKRNCSSASCTNHGPKSSIASGNQGKSDLHKLPQSCTKVAPNRPQVAPELHLSCTCLAARTTSVFPPPRRSLVSVVSSCPHGRTCPPQRVYCDEAAARVILGPAVRARRRAGPGDRPAQVLHW